MAPPTDVQQYLSSLLVTDRRCLMFLYQAIHGQKSIQSMEQAVAELVAHVRRNAGRAPNALRQWLRSPGTLQRAHRQALVRLVGYYRDESVTDDLMGILRQLPFVDTHPEAIAALAQVQGIRASKTLTDLLWSAPPHQWHVRETAILRELGRLGWTHATPHLIKALGVPYNNPARAAAAALARFAPDDVMPQLLQLIQSGQDPRQIAGAAEALGRLGDKRAVPALQQGSRSSNPDIATASAVALARLGDPTAEQRLVRLAYSDSGHAGAGMRARALGALGMLAKGPDQELSEEAISTLFRGLEDSQPEVRSAAASALGQSGRASTSWKISEALSREVSPLFRTAMIKALGRLGHQKSLPIMLQYLQRDDISVRIEVLDALANFRDPRIAQHISPHRSSSDPRLVEAANKALRRLLYRPFVWPHPDAIDAPHNIPLYNLEDARNLLLPPPPSKPSPGFFGRLFGARIPEPPAPPTPSGRVIMTPEGVRTEYSDDHPPGTIEWGRRFSLQITREPIGQGGSEESGEDIGIHFVLRQRIGQIGADFQTVAVSLWCAPSSAVGRLPAKSERFPCLDPHNAEAFLAALRWYMEVHGEPIAVG